MRHLTIYSEWKEVIDEYGSLSAAYVEEKNKIISAKANKKKEKYKIK